MEIIKFGISRNYVNSWKTTQAIREIYQNFIDFGDFKSSQDENESELVTVQLANSFSPNNWEFLKVGFSKKSGESIGGHGEGLKLAGLIFLRQDLQFYINCPLGLATPVFYQDENLGECYGLQIDSSVSSDEFKIVFEAQKEDIKVFEEGYIKKEDIVQSCYYGDIVSKTPGNVYIGGLFVCKLDKFKHAFNFKPSMISLGRDRDVPSNWDLEYYSNQIILACAKDLDFKSDDIFNREYFTGDIPNELASKFTPILNNQGDLSFKSGKTVVTDNSLVYKLKTNSTLAPKVEKLRYKAILKGGKKSPYNQLIELRDGLSLNQSQRIKFETILKLSKNWKNK